MTTNKYLKKLLPVFGFVFISSFLLVGYTMKEGAVEVISPMEIFNSNSPVPLEVLYHESKSGNEIGDFYLAELIMSSKSDGKIVFKDLKSGNRAGSQMVLSLQGNHIEGSSSSNAEFDDFVFQNYTEWCGRWRNGIRGQWRMCTGEDCGEGLAICFQRRR